MSAGAMASLAVRPVLAVFALAVLVALLHLPGNMLLPPLDRTEVIYAQTAKQMLEADGPGWRSWTAPAFQAEPKFEKPLAVLWLQAASAWSTGQVDQIRVYRVPSLLGTLLAVLLTYWGARQLFDARVAFLGAALLATMLVVTVQATLAMPEALMLAATCAALFALGRVYVAPAAADVEAGAGPALLFWTALGASVLVSVFTVPVIVLLTVLALVISDRGDSRWLWRLLSLPGIIVFLASAALWPLVLWQAGTLDAAIAQWRGEGWHLLLGPQEMKWRVLPGLFVVFLLLGMFPAGLFLGPALLTAWRERATPAIRFLAAWILPYLIFLELFTRKTPLYMVQAMLPPLAVLFAVWVMRGTIATSAVTEAARAHDASARSTPSPADDVPHHIAPHTGVGRTDTRIGADAEIHGELWFRLGTYGWLALVAGLVIALWVLPFLLKMWVSPLAVLLGLAALALAVVATKAMLEGHRLAAATSLVASGLAFNNLTIPVTLAGLRPVWVATEVRAAIDSLRACRPGGVALHGFAEPSGVFELSLAGDTGDSARVYRVWSASAFQQHMKRLQNARVRPPGAIACVAAYDFIHACSHRFTIWAAGERADFERCALPPRFHCENVPETPMIGKMCK